MTNIRHRAFIARSNRILEEGSTKEQIAQRNAIEPISQNHCAMTDKFAKQTDKNLTSYRLNVLTSSKKVAFTLAEVLITLGIIGIVAAITLPTLINNYQKKVTVTRLKHAYSVLSQAIEQSEAINGEIVNWDFNEQFFDKYLLPYIKNISKQELTENGALGITYREISGNPESSLRFMWGCTIYTFTNGTQILSKTYNNSKYQGLIIDTNGFAKPNQFGKDLFYFIISKEHKFYPMGRYNNSECSFPTEPNNDRNILKGNYCNEYRYGCNKNERGMWCGALIMTDGWEIKSDYPW